MTNFALNEPYPSINDVKPNKNDLLIILNNYAGLISELSAITQYIYHKQIFDCKNSDKIASTLLQIAIIEMRHLNIFGNLITKLGGNPKFVYKSYNNFQFWSANMIDCETNILKMLESDLKLELETINAYTNQAKWVSQPEIAETLLRIVKDEQLHAEILQNLIIEIKKTES